MSTFYDLSSDTMQAHTRRYERERALYAVADTYSDALDFAIDAWTDADNAMMDARGIERERETATAAFMRETAQYADTLADSLASAHSIIDASMRFDAQRDSAAGITLR